MQFMLAASAIGASAVVAWRVREARRALTVPAIILPPLGMSTGFTMFVVPDFRVPLAWALTAFLAGFLAFSYPLVRTSVLTRVGDQVLLRGSRAFLVVILALAALRLALHEYIGHFITPMQTAGIFFILAFGMIVRWRAHMLIRFRALSAPRD
jgi:membrane protein CcdC involved in cytochrome C biogenesis